MKTYTKTKTWIHILLVVFSTIIVTRYMWTVVEDKYYMLAVLSAMFCQNLIMYLICFFYIEKSFRLSENLGLVYKLLLYATPIFITLFILNCFYSARMSRQISNDKLCLTPTFMFQTGLNLLISVMSIAIASYVQNKVN